MVYVDPKESMETMETLVHEENQDQKDPLAKQV